MKLVIKLLSYGIIMSIVSIIISKKNSKNNDSKITKDGEFCWEQKIVSKILLICGIIFSILFIFISSFPSNIEGNTKIIVSVCFILFNILLYVLSYIYYVMFIKLTDDKIIYNLGFSTKELLYTEIANAKKDLSGNILLYKGNKKVLKIPKEFTFAESKLKYLKIIEQENKNEFVMQVPKFYRGLMVTCCVVFTAFLVLGAYTNNWYVVVFFGIMLIFSLLECINEFKLKIIVSKNEIKKISLFYKKNITISNITKVETRTIDNAEWLYLFSKNGLEIKINTLYTNSYLLKEMLKNKIV